MHVPKEVPEVLSVGDVVEFRHQSDNKLIGESKYVDRISEVIFHSDGSVEYGTELYGECPGYSHLTHDRIVRVIERSGEEPPEMPAFPYSKGDRVEFNWDDGIRHGTVEEAMYVDTSGVYLFTVAGCMCYLPDILRKIDGGSNG